MPIASQAHPEQAAGQQFIVVAEPTHLALPFPSIVHRPRLNAVRVHGRVHVNTDRVLTDELREEIGMLRERIRLAAPEPRPIIDVEPEGPACVRHASRR
jgi:hypothetical protein